MKRHIRHLWGIVVVGMAFGGVLPYLAVAAPPCAPPHRLRVVDLAMVPDPIRQGRQIKEIHVTLQSDRNGECNTSLEVRDQDQVVTRARAQSIRPGQTVFVLPVVEGYRFSGQDRCFIVHVNVGGTYSPVDAQQVFCARLKTIPVWTLKGD